MRMSRLGTGPGGALLYLVMCAGCVTVKLPRSKLRSIEAELRRSLTFELW